MRFFKKVFDFFKYDIPYGVQNLIYWFKVIWNDRDWDYYFIYVILRHKISSMEPVFRKYGNHVGVEKEADRMKLCILLLDRLIKDDYLYSAMKQHDEKWGEGKIKYLDTENPELKRIEIEHENVKTLKDQELEHKDFKSAMDHERRLKKQDLDLLFKILNKHIESWWD